MDLVAFVQGLSSEDKLSLLSLLGGADIEVNSVTHKGQTLQLLKPIRFNVQPTIVSCDTDYFSMLLDDTVITYDQNWRQQLSDEFGRHIDYAYREGYLPRTAYAEEELQEKSRAFLFEGIQTSSFTDETLGIAAHLLGEKYPEDEQVVSYLTRCVGQPCILLSIGAAKGLLHCKENIRFKHWLENVHFPYLQNCDPTWEDTLIEQLGKDLYQSLVY